MDIKAVIRQAAIDEGIPPAYALAVAERESDFNPNARASKTIRGLFQFTGSNRARLGLADNASPAEQVRALADHSIGIRNHMASVMGRDPSDAETYLGHHFGSGRAAAMLNSDPNDRVSSWFDPEEMAANPHFAKAGTVGNLVSSITSDINRREAKYADSGEAPAQGSNQGLTRAIVSEGGPPDFSKFGVRVPDLDPAASIAMASGQPVSTELPPELQPRPVAPPNQVASQAPVPINPLL